MTTYRRTLAFSLTTLFLIAMVECCQMSLEMYMDSACTVQNPEYLSVARIGEVPQNQCSGTINGPRESAHRWNCTEDGTGVIVQFCAPDHIYWSRSTCKNCDRPETFYHGGCEHSEFLATYVKAVYLEHVGGCCGPSI
eukprot:CAMPEP_0183308516 /NCGR_PEP_ID=MMETSP0160_2-20130417/22307_1 /TAXON_ID=2839 ORGANISM="Odontella Sinensis, Strain Grunow 1884" /NCGR_SAMPLE_ID=MMETSP0160_2 /ASSEMBLY_ACC=CAM_ASM_000250 /LENGTH=137 /DNA_ID=CAMNT_0025472371 /DNA_START=48 /DNA_END=461 /DNA_ORIENTATION=+